MRTAGVVLTLTLAAGGFAQDVRYNFDRSADFSRFKTFKWVQIKGAAPIDQLTESQLKGAIGGELAKKGLTKSSGEEADLWIGLQVAIGQEKEFTSYTTDYGWGYGPGWGRGWGAPMGGMTTGHTSTIHVGTAALDMYDPARKQLVWRGQASKTLDEKAKPDKRQKNIEKGAAKLLKDFPPKIK
jgi:hypothetical protein